MGILQLERHAFIGRGVKSRATTHSGFFDSPPIMGVSDASVLASEGGPGHPGRRSTASTPADDPSGAAFGRCEEGRAPMGVVLNNINISRDSYYYYYSGLLPRLRSPRATRGRDW